MNRLYRPLAAILVSATALHLVGCTGEEPGSPPGVTFTTSPSSTVTPSSTETSSPTPTDDPSDSATPPVTDENPSFNDGASDNVIGSVTVTVSAPEKERTRLDRFDVLQVGENRFEMVEDLQRFSEYKTLPAVSWETGVRSGKCSTRITYSDQSGELIARKDSRQCEFIAAKDEADNDFEWIDRSLLPEKGSEAPVIVRVSVTPDGGSEATGEKTIVIRNPDTSR